MQVSLTFWGVRGAYPTPRSENLGVGGNTSCVEIRTEDEVLIIDGGTGIQKCGHSIMENCGDEGCELSILFSHFHWDHVQGLPFFTPLYARDSRLRFLSPLSSTEMQGALHRVMGKPFFPVSWDETPASKQLIEIPRMGLGLKRMCIQPFPLNHPQGAHGYRVATERGAIVYASDLEHGDAEFDAILRRAAKDAAVLIYDAQYTPEEYPTRAGWGHSTWLEAVKLAREADVQRLILFHHHPTHTDSMMAVIQGDARSFFAATDVATEGVTIDV